MLLFLSPQVKNWCMMPYVPILPSFWVSGSKVLNILITLCNHLQHRSPELFSSCKTETLNLLNNLHFIPIQPLAPTSPLFQVPHLKGIIYVCLFQFSSVAQSCPTLCDPMNRSTPGLPVHHHLTEFTQTHVHRVSDAIQPSHPRSSPSPPAPNPSQHQSLFQWVNSSHEVAKVLDLQL